MSAAVHSKYLEPHEEAIPTGDGMELWTDYYLPPEGEGPWPVVLMRSAYPARRAGLMNLASQLARAGMATVLQEVRGRYRSPGSFLSREGQDGLDTLAWLARQSWSNGKVGLCGLSLSTYSLLLLATLPPPAGVEICTAVNLLGTIDIHGSLLPAGALQLHWALPWCSMMHEKWSRGLTGWNFLPWKEYLRHLPLATASELVWGTVFLWDDLIVSHPVYDESWQPFDLRERLRKLEIPILHVGGWYDHILEQVLSGYAIGRAQSASCSLMVGPWDHQTMFLSMFGRTVDGGRPACTAPVALSEPVLAWFRRWLRSEDPPADAAGDPPEVLLFVMGERVWLSAETFPLPEAEVVDWYLSSDGHANTAAGDGRLDREHPAAGRDTFVHDPQDPVPTCGGPLWPFSKGGIIPGPEDQTEVEERADVLVYTSPPLAAELIVVGPLEVELWAASSCPDTDFTAKLVDVDGEGVPRIIQDGIVRARFRETVSEARFLQPNRPYRFTISLTATGCVFRRGHRVRLEVASSNFPKYDRNWNTRTPPVFAAAGPPAHQVVFFGGDKPSRLRLPILTREQLEARRWTPPPEWELKLTPPDEKR